MQPSSHKSVNIVCGVDFSRFSKNVQFVSLASSVLGLFIVYGYVQEKLFRIPGFRSHGWYLSFIQFVFVSFISFLDSTFISRSPKRRELPPYYEFMILSWMTVGTIGLSTVSLGFLNFPTQVIFKSCKLIPVMIGGILILGKKYTIYDYCSVFCMCFGLIWFSLADQTVSPEFEPKGIVIICMALCFDAVFGNYQEKLLKKYPHFTNADIIFYTYSFGSLIILTWLCATGQFLSSLKYASQHHDIYPLAMIYATVGYLGVQFVLALIKSSGVLITTFVTTTRKVLTVVLSFIFFTKPFTFQYVWSGSLVFLGICISIWKRNRIAILNNLSNAIRGVQAFVGAHSTPLSKLDRTVLQV